MWRNNSLSVAVLFCFLTALCPIAAAQIIYVDVDAPGPAHDGSDWPAAYNHLQDALARAVPGDKIRVADGTYKPDCDIANPTGTGDRTATFQLIGGVTIIGGYAGFGAPDPNERDIYVYQTILSGDLRADDRQVSSPCLLPEEIYRADNCHHVLTATYTDETAVLNGFTIRGGKADTLDGGNRIGGGMFIEHASPTIIDCTFTGNLAESFAGGIYIGGLDSAPKFTGCSFIGNFAGIDGGGLFNNGAASLLMRCTFTANCAGSKGGGMVEAGVSTLLDCIFTENSSSFAGGAMATGPHFLIGPATLINCLFIRNSADRHGGAMDSYIAAVFMYNCTFVDNTAPEGSALSCSSFPQEPPTFVRAASCIFRNGGDEVLDGGYSTIQIVYSNIQGGWSGPGDIDQDPLFVDTTVDDYHLRWDSPCINSGDPGLVIDPNFPTDIDGEPRIMGMRVDMGADEVGPKQADFTRDGRIDIADFAVFSRSWDTQPTSENWYILCDLFEDDIIDINDLAALAADWIWVTEWH
jgi:hypothetical protein